MSLIKKKTRLDGKIQLFREWWVGLEPEARARNEERLKKMGEIAQSIIDEQTGDGFGPKFVDVLVEAGKGFFLFGKTAPDLLIVVKRQMPEVWPLLGPFLPTDVTSEMEALERAKV